LAGGGQFMIAIIVLRYVLALCRPEKPAS
jgi:hypothetical protein